MGSHNNMWSKRGPGGKFAKKNSNNNHTPSVSSPSDPVTQLVAKAVGGAPVAVKPNLVNHIAIVLDHSGSMYGIRESTLNHLNKTIESIVENAKKTGQETTVSLYRFGTDIYPFGKRNYSSLCGVTEDFFNTPAHQVIKLTTYNPSGNTPLLDGVGYAIERLQTLPDANKSNVSFLVLVLTDGFENMSQKYNSVSLAARMAEVQSTDRWTLTFLVPPGNKNHLCSAFNIPTGNVQEWEATTRGMQLASHQTQTGVTHYYAARGMGSTSSTAFYTDFSNLSATNVKSNLQNIQDKVKLLRVEKETEIRPFVEEKIGKYDIGTAFYQLTKPEKVQAGKQILVKEKNGTAVYGGYDARKVLGIPEGVELKVTPGNHSNWDVYIQSTSTNRKLVRGTSLVVLK